MQELAPYMGIGTQLCFTVLAFVALGWYIDEQIGSAPMYLGILGAIGAVVGLVNLIRSLNNISKKSMDRTAVRKTLSNEEN